MPHEISRERLADLLVDPREDLDFEVKNWLDLQGNVDDKATFAKAVLALANHGGGFIALGLEETADGVVEAEGRPANLDGYNQDLVNGIVRRYCEPAFHCAVFLVPDPGGARFPVVPIPGGHRVPIQARRGSPNGTTVRQNMIYVRKPGPRSEAPQNAQEWNELLERCLRNRREEMLEQMRDLIAGTVPQADIAVEHDRLNEWKQANLTRWRGLVDELPPDAAPRLTHGSYLFAYEIVGEQPRIGLEQLPDVLRGSVVRHTGWPPFWYPTRRGIEPYPIDGAVECWLGRDPGGGIVARDAAHSDFWRITPNGLAFLLRGYQEDGADIQRAGRAPRQPGTIFDVTLPVWRVGEALLHAERLAANLFDGPTTIRFEARFDGLEGRSLVSVTGNRHVREGQVSRQGSISLSTSIDSQSIGSSLPEVVHPLLCPLYALFDFFQLPMQLVTTELGRMRANRF